MSDPFSLIVEGAVAVGTLSLAYITWRQTRLLTKQEESRAARVMAERVYLPIRPEVSTWANQDQAIFSKWKELKETATLWAFQVPGDLSSLLNEAEALFERIGALRIQVRDACQEELDREGEKLSQKANLGTQQFSTQIRVLSKFSPWSVDLTNPFVLQKTFNDYLTDVAANGKYVLTPWWLEVLVDGRNAGSKTEAEAIASNVLGYLNGRPDAVEFRDKLLQAKRLGQEVMPAIDRELRKARLP